MRTIRLTIEYDGTAYAGWQVQPNGCTIQQVLEEALARLSKDPVRLVSSGRTDAGVHAAGMVAVFSTISTIPLRAFLDGLNTLLPPDIAIQEVTEVEPGFNPRRAATGKHYRYTIYNALRRSPLNRHDCWHVRSLLDLEAMGLAAAHFVGEHDFAAFRAANCAAKTSVRRINRLDITRNGPFVVIDINGTGFLKYMVRIIVGTLVEVGQGKRAAADIPFLLAGRDRASSGPTAPPHGLCLMEVFYGQRVLSSEAGQVTKQGVPDHESGHSEGT